MPTVEALVGAPRGARGRTLARVRRGLPHLGPDGSAELARIVDVLVREFHPAFIYVFGSQARGDATRNSDVDLLVVVEYAGPYPHRLAQAAYAAIGAKSLALDLVFMSWADFAWRSEVVTSLPATVRREGRLLYAAARPATATVAT